MSKGFEMIIIGILIMVAGVCVLLQRYAYLRKNILKLKDRTIIMTLLIIVMMGIQIVLGLCLFGIGINNILK